MIPEWKIYPRSQGHSTVYLQNVVTDPAIQVGAYTIYDDFVNDPRDFQRNNVLYHYPECNHDRLIIGILSFFIRVAEVPRKNHLLPAVLFFTDSVLFCLFFVLQTLSLLFLCKNLLAILRNSRPSRIFRK